MRIDKIEGLKCVGCLACADVCNLNAIKKSEDSFGFVLPFVDESICVNCGKCVSVCPAVNSVKKDQQQTLYATYSKNAEVVKKASSGGVFSLLANYFIEKGYLVCGAAFNDKLELYHKIISTKQEIDPLCKSKYLQSNTCGVFTEIKKLLVDNKKVFFVGTPCQVSALNNFLTEKEKQNLFTADFICHGVPSQKVFSEYIKTLEEKHSAKVVDFSFRVKDNKYKHANGFSYKILKGDKQKVINGIYTQSGFYNAFKDYKISRESCYDCKYTTLNRVSDITLGDFWGIEKYQFKANTDKGVSMLLLNSLNGQKVFDEIREFTVCKQFPVEYGVESNYCLTNTTKKPKKYTEIMDSLKINGYAKTEKMYFLNKNGIKWKIYWAIPPFIRNILRKLRTKK